MVSVIGFDIVFGVLAGPAPANSTSRRQPRAITTSPGVNVRETRRQDAPSFGFSVLFPDLFP